MIYYQLLIFWSKPIIQPTQLLAGMCRLYSLYSLYTFIYNIEQVELGFKAAISKPLTWQKIWDTLTKKRTNEQSHIWRRASALPKNEKSCGYPNIFESRDSACKSKENQSQKSSKNVSSERQLLQAQTAKTYTSKAGRPPSHWRLLCDKNAQGGS